MTTHKPETTDQKLDYLISQIEKIDSLEKRLEEVRVDTNTIKHEAFKTSLTLTNLERKTDIIKIDVEDAKREISDINENVKHLLHNSVTHKEYEALEERVTTLEQS